MNFGNLAGSLENLSGGGGKAAMVSAVIGMIESHPGGFSGLVQSFEQQGLGAVVNSWISTGPNQPVSAQQVQQTLGNDQIQNVAQKLGVDSGQASNILAQYLPSIVDHLTPNGQVPSGGSNLTGMAENVLSGLIHKNI